MTRFLLTTVSLLPVLCAPGVGIAELAPEPGEVRFPRPAELQPDVDFWVRIYTEVDGNGGLIHDSRHLDVVYETVRFPEGTSRRGRERIVDRVKSRYRSALRTLAKGKRTGLSSTQAQVLELWPEGVSNSTLRTASSRLRFQLGQSDKFRAGLIRSGAWREYIHRTFREMGLPEELAALPHVESSFTPFAYSRVGAAGLWQFTRSTGRRYMRVDHVVDERLDPLIATIAAGRLLDHNRQSTGSWPLALTAYNHGAAGMRRAARKMGTRDIATINRKYKSRTFGFASRNFYPEFLAALQIDQNPERYFGPLVFDTPEDFEVVALPKYASAARLSEALSVDIEVLKESNPSLLASVWNGAKRIPKGHPLRVPRALVGKPLAGLIAATPDTAWFASQTRDTYHKIRRGETLSAIARRYGTTMSELAHLNGLRSRHRIRAGQLLRLPEESGSRGRRTARASASSEPPANGVYIVRRGDTLERISSRYGVSEQDLMEWNGIRNRHRIARGQRLRVVDSGATASAIAEVASAPAGPEPQAAPAVVAEPVVIAEAEPAAVEQTLPAPEPPSPHPELLAELTTPPSALADFESADSEDSIDAARDTGSSLVPTDETDPTNLELPADPSDPSDYSVAADGTIEIQAAETLGHYAEWLDVRASRLRRVNHMSFGTPVSVGDRILLDFARVTPQEFETRRSDHHRALQGEFFAGNEIVGSQSHRVRRGESIWLLAERKYDVPLWLLRQYNPDVDFSDLHAGMQLTIPKVRPR